SVMLSAIIRYPLRSTSHAKRARPNCGAALPMQIDVNNQPSILALGPDSRTGKFTRITGQHQNALKAAIGDFQLMVTPAIGDERIAPYSAHDELVVYQMHFEIVRFHPGKVELYLQTLRRAVDVSRRFPERTARPTIAGV